MVPPDDKISRGGLLGRSTELLRCCNNRKGIFRMNTGDDRATNLIGCVPSHRRRSRIPGLSSSSGSTSPALQCTDLARELMEIDVVTNDDVPIWITNQEVVA